MADVKLLTEAEVDSFLSSLGLTSNRRDAIANFIREHGLIAPEPDPLLVEAREICSDAMGVDYSQETVETRGALLAAYKALKRGMELARDGGQQAYSPAPKWVQDSIPDWAFERVAQLVGSGDKHGPRGSRAGVAFARYLADNPQPKLTWEMVQAAFEASKSLEVVVDYEALHAALQEQLKEAGRG